MSNCPICGKIPIDKRNIYCSKKCRGQDMMGEKNHFYGKRHTEENLLKIRRKGKGNGIKKTEEHKLKIGLAQKGKIIKKESIVQANNTRSLQFLFGKKGPRTGIIVKESSKQKMSLAKKGKPMPQYLKYVRTEQHRKHLSELMTDRLVNKKGPFKNTKPELKLKSILLDLGLIENSDFIHQYYIKDIKHKYVADFYIPSKKLVLECDGDYYHGNEQTVKIDNIGINQKKKDIYRNNELTLSGRSILRFWGSDIMKHPEEVKQQVQQYLEEI